MKAKERTLIVGTSELALSLVTEIQRRPRCPYRLMGLIGERDAIAGLSCPFLGTVRDLQQAIVAARPARIVLALSEQRGLLPGGQLVEARVWGDIKVEKGVDVYERLTGMMAIESLTPANVLFSKDLHPSRVSQVFARLWSLLVAALGLVFSGPLLVLVAVLIKLDSTGPVFFVQERIGKGLKRFRLVKFRSMHETQVRPSEWELDNGHRITRVGHWLRKYRLDELPQLINVIRGEMNIVGPRPHPATNEQLFVLVSRNIPQHGVSIPYYSLRTTIRPGITGWAQVRYRYANGLDEEMEKLRYDLYYIKHYSAWLDLRILLETVRVMLFPHRNDKAGPTEARTYGTAGTGPQRAEQRWARAAGRDGGTARIRKRGMHGT